MSERATSHDLRTCTCCGGSLASRRIDAKFCCGGCRAAASRTSAARTPKSFAEALAVARRQTSAQRRTNSPSEASWPGEALVVAILADPDLDAVEINGKVAANMPTVEQSFVSGWDG